MPLTSLSLQSSLSWQLQAAITNFASLTQGTDTINFNAAGATWNLLFAKYYSLAAAGTQTIDLFSFTNLVNEATVFGHAFALVILVDAGAGGNILVQPGATNPLQWFWNGATQGINLPNGAGFTFQLPVTATGQVVDATHRNLLFTNSGGSTCGFKVAVLGA